MEFVVMADRFDNREGNIGWVSRDGLNPVDITGVREHGMVGRYVHERGIPCAVLQDESTALQA